MKRRRLPKKGARLHYDPCPGQENLNRWTGEYRGCVDGEYIAVRVWSRRKRRWYYILHDRWWWDTDRFKPGPLPSIPASPGDRGVVS